MSVDKHPLLPILVHFRQDLKLNGLGERTQQSYTRNVRKFSVFLKRELNSASEDDLRNYRLFIMYVERVSRPVITLQFPN
jgi:hypothetical protein